MKILSILVALFLTLHAQESTPQQQKIQNMISDIKNASSDERFLKMNAFKKQLRQMNSEARKEAIRSLQMTLKAKANLEHQQMGKNPQLEIHKHQKQIQVQHQMQNQNELQKNGPRNAGPNFK